MEKDKIEVTLPNGMTVKGTIEQIQNVARLYGFTNVFDDMYYSESKRTWIVIKEMDTQYLCNALRAKYRTWAENLNGLSAKDLCNMVTNGPTDKVFVNLLVELEKRTGF